MGWILKGRRPGGIIEEEGEEMEWIAEMERGEGKEVEYGGNNRDLLWG